MQIVISYNGVTKVTVDLLTCFVLVEFSAVITQFSRLYATSLLNFLCPYWAVSTVKLRCMGPLTQGGVELG